MIRTIQLPAIALFVAAVLGSSARGGEQKIPLGEVPKVVIDAVKAKYPAAELKEAVKETVEGKTTYEVSLKNKGTKLNVSVNVEGKILEVEREIPVEELPRKARRAIEAKYSKATLKTAEEVTEFNHGGEEKSFEVKIVAADGKSHEVEVDEDGEIEEEAADKPEG